MKLAPLGPCIYDRAESGMPSSRMETSVRPNQTLVFSILRFQFRPPRPQYRPSTAPDNIKHQTTDQMKENF